MAVQTDWYLWTIKHVATDKKHGKKGLGTRVVRESINQSEKEGAKAIAADITYDNMNSLKLFQKHRFKPVNEFCWKKGKKPAYIVHHVFYPPTKNHKCPK
jgi:L-amino acid N-acyltransferase YncA